MSLKQLPKLTEVDRSASAGHFCQFRQFFRGCPGAREGQQAVW